MKKLLSIFIASLGLALGLGLVYLLATDSTIRVVVLVLGSMLFGWIMVLVPVLLTVKYMSRGPSSVTHHAGNHRYPSLPSQAPAQLPAPNWDRWEVLDVAPVEQNSNDEVVG